MAKVEVSTEQIKEAAENKKLLRRLYLVFKGWDWDVDEVPYYAMMALRDKFEKKRKKK